MRELIIFIFISNLVFASGSYGAKEDDSPQNQLRELKEERKQIRSNLEKIPGLQEKIKKFQEVIKRSSKQQRRMAKLYFKSRKICEKLRAKLELKGRSYNSIQRSYNLCKNKINGNGSVYKFHRKFMKDIKRFKQKIKEDIENSEELMDQKDSIEIETEYIDEAINILEDYINGNVFINHINFCEVDNFNLLEKFREARANWDYRKLRLMSKCLKYQNRYNRYATYNILDDNSNATLYRTIVYLNKFGKSSDLAYLLNSIKPNIRKLSFIKNGAFGIEVGYKSKYPNNFYLGVFYLKNGTPKYIQYLGNQDNFQKWIKINLSNLKTLQTTKGGYLKLNYSSKVKLAQLIEKGLKLND